MYVCECFCVCTPRAIQRESPFVFFDKIRVITSTNNRGVPSVFGNDWNSEIVKTGSLETGKANEKESRKGN